YPAGPVAKSGFLMNYTCRTGSSRPIENCRHGKAFYGTNGVLVLSRAGFEIYPDEQGEPAPARTVTTRQKEHDIVIEHVRGFLECVRARKQPEATIEVGHRASNPGHLMNIAWRVGRKIKWDAAGERIPGDSEANGLLSREYRAGYELPT